MTLTIGVVGGPNDTQFSDWVHDGGTYVRVKADHASGTHNLLMGADRLGWRNELERTIGGKDPTA